MIVRKVPLTLTELTRSQSSVLISHIGGCELSSVIPAFATRILGGPKVLLADSNAAAMEASDVRSPLTQCSLRFCSGVVARVARLIARRSRAVTRQPWPAKVMSQNAACALQGQELCAVHTLRNSCTATPPIPPALPSVVLLISGGGLESHLQHQSQRHGGLQGRGRTSLPAVLWTFQAYNEGRSLMAYPCTITRAPCSLTGWHP